MLCISLKKKSDDIINVHFKDLYLKTFVDPFNHFVINGS